MMPQRAVILAAGKGTRLKWLTDHRPKALMPMAGEVAVVRVIRRLAASGVRFITLNVHHHAEQLMAYLGDGSAWGVSLSYSFEADLLDSGGGVRTALEFLPGEGSFFVHNADIMTNLDLRALAARKGSHACCVGLVANPLHHANGDFTFNQGVVRRDGGSRFTFSGVSVWDESIWMRFSAKQSFSMLALLNELMAEDQCRGYLHRGFWYDIGRPRDLLQAQSMLSRL